MHVTDVAISDLTPDPDNIRDTALDDITALAADIRDRGLQVPLQVYPDGARYKIWAGHRRWAALCMLGAAYATCTIKPAPRDALDKLDGMVSENLHRAQLNPIEEAKVFARYAALDVDQAAIARRCGVSQSKVSGFLLLLTELSEAEQLRVARGELAPTTALKTVRNRRVDRGVARADSGQRHDMTTWAPHFNRQHPLAAVADARCRNGRHNPADRIGGACGVCWEQAIRRDERAAADLDGTTPAPAPAQQQVLACARCGIDYRTEVKYDQCVVIDKGANKRLVAAQHNWRHRADKSRSA